MPTYRVTDPTTGKTVKLTGDAPPTEQELEEIFSSLGGTAPESQEDTVPDWGRENPNLYGLYGAGKALYEQVGKPVVETAGLAAGALAGVPAGPAGMAAGAGLGYGMARQGLQLAEEKIGGAPEQPLPERMLSAGKDVATGAAMEAGGQTLVKGAQLAGRGLAAVTKPVQKQFYESALKIPPSVPKAVRDIAVEKGIQGHYVPSEKGLVKLSKDIKKTNKEIATLIDHGTKAGKNINTSKALQYLDELKQFYQSLPAPRAKPFLDEITEFEVGIKAAHGQGISMGEAQKMKQALYRLHKKHYGELKTLSIELDKTLARGIKDELVRLNPDLAKLNADDSAMINLMQILERSVNRIRNYDVIRMGDTIMSMTGAVLGGPGGAAGAGITKRIIEAPTVKARIAFALSKAAKVKGAPTASRVAAVEAVKDEED